eukprot:g1638.t1
MEGDEGKSTFQRFKESSVALVKANELNDENSARAILERMHAMSNDPTVDVSLQTLVDSKTIDIVKLCRKSESEVVSIAAKSLWKSWKKKFYTKSSSSAVPAAAAAGNKKTKTAASASSTFRIPRHETISLTFGDRAENHAGMQCIGDLAESGFTYEELQKMNAKWIEAGAKTELISLHERLPSEDLRSDRAHRSGVLIIRNGLAHLLKKERAADDLWREQRRLDFDKKALFRGKVKNKRARWNLCFAERKQEPDYAQGKGRIVAFDDCAHLKELRGSLASAFGEKAANLYAELNMYYDVTKCGIGFHGDSERKIVICARIGASMPMDFQWFLRFRPVGERCSFVLNHGDVYVMSEKATGCDWKKSSIYTLRHAAGCKKYRTTKRK